LGLKKFGSGIRDGKHSDPVSGINIPDPLHCCKLMVECTFPKQNIVSAEEKTARARPDGGEVRLGQNPVNPPSSTPSNSLYRSAASHLNQAREPFFWDDLKKCVKL
jgi:hypothetical protein